MNTTHGIFITGTGTDIGKTYVSALLVKELRRQQKNAGYYKPVLSGAILRNHQQIPGDVEYVCQIANLPNPPKDLVSYCFETPVSPHLAASLEQKKIELPVILQDFQSLSKQFDFLVVEGCGGLFCPLCFGKNPLFLTDIIQKLGLEILIVTSAELGSLHNIVTTVNYAKQCHLSIKGIVLNQFDSTKLVHQDNKKQMERLTGLPIIACVSPHATNLSFSL